MIRLRAVLRTALALLLGATTLTACSSDPTPTAITIGWADNTRQAVQVSWQDSDAPNRITIEGVVSTSPSYVKYLAATEPNTWAIPSSAFPPDGNYKIAVAVGTSAGGVSSKLARSQMFDTDGPLSPSSATVTPKGKDVLVRWTVPPPVQDFSPGDPLDVAGQTQLYVPVVGRPGEPLRTVGPGTTSSRQLIKDLLPPYLFLLRAQNEWTSRTGGQISARTSSTSAAIPALAQFSVPVRIRGRVILQEVSCGAEGSCVQQRTTTAGLPVVLLTQVTPGARWTPAARGKTTSGGHYEVVVTTGSTRPYRVAVPLYSQVGSLAAPSNSRAAVMRATVRVQSAGFIGGGLKKRGENVTVFAVVKPPMNAMAVLQSWNPKAKAWTYLKTTRIRRGQTTFTFKAGKKAGSFVYRFVLPSAKFLGTPLYGSTTPNLVLRVR